MKVIVKDIYKSIIKKNSTRTLLLILLAACVNLQMIHSHGVQGYCRVT